MRDGAGRLRRATLLATIATLAGCGTAGTPTATVPSRPPLPVITVPAGETRVLDQSGTGLPPGGAVYWTSPAFSVPDGWSLTYAYSCANRYSNGGFSYSIKNAGESFSPGGIVGTATQSYSSTSYYYDGGSAVVISATTASSNCLWHYVVGACPRADCGTQPSAPPYIARITGLGDGMTRAIPVPSTWSLAYSYDCSRTAQSVPDWSASIAPPAPDPNVANLIGTVSAGEAVAGSGISQVSQSPPAIQLSIQSVCAWTVSIGTPSVVTEPPDPAPGPPLTLPPPRHGQRVLLDAAGSGGFGSSPITITTPADVFLATNCYAYSDVTNVSVAVSPEPPVLASAATNPLNVSSPHAVVHVVIATPGTYAFQVSTLGRCYWRLAVRA